MPQASLHNLAAILLRTANPVHKIVLGHANPTCVCMTYMQVLGRARRPGSVLGVYGQPEDHPFPAAAEELRYLKFILYRLDT